MQNTKKATRFQEDIQYFVQSLKTWRFWRTILLMALEGENSLMLYQALNVVKGYIKGRESYFPSSYLNIEMFMQSHGC